MGILVEHIQEGWEDDYNNNEVNKKQPDIAMNEQALEMTQRITVEHLIRIVLDV